ncbi:MAG: MotA/TolQ/ExbB proton channel family protein [Pseudomonadota bacterium]
MDDLATSEAGAALSQAAPGLDLLAKGGFAIWVIAALSVAMLALVLWKSYRLFRLGAWERARAEKAIAAWQSGHAMGAIDAVEHRTGACATLVHTAITALADPRLSPDDARAEVARIGRRQVSDAQSGLRGLELIATVAPLLGLFGTVLGMIAAFQALESAGAQADPSTLAGGIWEALLTTAAGMAVAIPASAALTWFEGVIESLRSDMEDMATRLFTTPVEPPLARAAE